MTVSVRCFCEFIRTEKFYAKSLAKWAELYYNITVLFFGIGINENAVYGENGDSLYVMDQIRDEDCNDEAWLENIALTEAMKKLKERERMVVDLRYFRGLTQEQTAAIVGVSQVQVSRIEKKIIESLRKENTKVIMMSPSGKTFNQEKAYSLSKEEHIKDIAKTAESIKELKK